MDEDIARIIAGNVRIPDAVLGDLKAQRNANRIGGDRLLELIKRYGHDTVLASVDTIMDRTEGLVRAEIGKLPNGRYQAVDYMDDTGRGTESVRIAVAVTIADDVIEVDFTGTDGQTLSGMNSPFNYTRAYVYWATKCMIAPELPQNDGGIRPIQVIAPEGSYVNPIPPAASGARALNNHRLTEVIFQAFAQAAPDRVIAASSHIAHPVIAGVDPNRRRPFVSYDLIIGGWGARATRDGCEALTMPSNARNIPVEVLEAEYPLAFDAFELIQDSGGAGEFRGGCGVRRDIRILTDNVTFGNMTDRQKFAPPGLFGGGTGGLGSTIINPGRTSTRTLAAKELVKLSDGDVVSSRLAGGGGYGDPLARDPEKVRHDVLDGYVSKEAALADYGVVLDTELSVDLGKTGHCRKDRCEDRVREDRVPG
jgi:N-methylhydantoinase B